MVTLGRTTFQLTLRVVTQSIINQFYLLVLVNTLKYLRAIRLTFAIKYKYTFFLLVRLKTVSDFFNEQYEKGFILYVMNYGG